MKIAIIGSGNVGGALAQSLIKTGHSVMMGAKLPLSEKSIRLAAEIGEEKFVGAEQAAAGAEIIIITTPPETIMDLVPRFGNTQDKVIIDATNSVRTKPEGFATVFHAVKYKTGNDKVVKCFNTTGFENMLNPVYKGQGIDMFCAGNNEEAKMLAVQLAKDIGFANCYDFGGDDKVELLEKLALSWINLAILQKQGRDIAFKVVRR